MADEQQMGGLSRRDLLRAGAVVGVGTAIGGVTAGQAAGATSAVGPPGGQGDRLVLVNGKIHTMDADNRVVDSVAIENGRFVEVGPGVQAGSTGVTVVNLKGRTVLPGLIDGHTHLVLVGNRPGHHVLLEDVFTIDGVIERYAARAEDVPAGEWITTIGPIAAQQFPENRLPVLSELDAIDRPVYIQAAQGGTRTNSLGKALLEAQGVVVAPDGVIAGGATGSALALRLLREQLLTPETRVRTSRDAMQYYNGLGLTTHLDQGAFHSELPAGGIASENTYTMHNPFLTLNREGSLPARLRINFLHQDPASDPTLPTLAPRLRNSFPFFGNDMLRTGGIGEFTGGGVEGLRAIARAGWRAEDHALSLAQVTNHIVNREIVHAEIPITDLRWVISHVPQITEELLDRFDAMGGGLFVGWGPTRTGTNVGPPYRLILDHGIRVGYHADGGDITVINPWLNFYTMITGRNLAGAHILGDQLVTRQEAIWLATAANKWFIGEDDLGSIEVGNHADLIVLDRDFFTVPDEDIKTLRSVLTIIAGKVVHDTGDL
jgi:predicted amidohydrolase YtcJ